MGYQVWGWVLGGGMGGGRAAMGIQVPLANHGVGLGQAPRWFYIAQFQLVLLRLFYD